ncbi:restriction endonuclease subunit S [Inediibacterium massiliense]|uniref:restriction endonuclease subunit S n=1 Tax=Inediibacterium massiliense TaxID=1658111 RepID=UPI0006B5553E|nr:restriction endonuclease subunit S [Inediibacterium massiliense]
MKESNGTKFIIKELRDVVEIDGGYAFKSDEFMPNKTPIIRIGNIVEGNVVIDNNIGYDIENQDFDKYIIKNQDILIAMSGATTGKLAMYKNNTEALLNQRVGRLNVICEDILDNNYLYYYLRSDFVQNKIKVIASGCAQPNISSKQILSIEIPVPLLEIQKKIVRVLEKAEKALEKRKEAINLLDELVKSRFVEMFGDLISNSYNWKTIKLKDICSLKSGGTPTRNKPEYFRGDIPWITTVALGNNLIDEKDAVEFITQEAIDNSSTKLIKEGSLLFGMRVGVGKISVNAIPMCTNQDIMAITEIDTNKYNLLFLKKVIESYSEYFNNQKRGATIQGIKSDTLKGIDIPIVEIKIQIEFVNFVNQTDKLKCKMEKSLEELENNFHSLMQRAFNGELFS